MEEDRNIYYRITCFIYHSQRELCKVLSRYHATDRLTDKHKTYIQWKCNEYKCNKKLLTVNAYDKNIFVENTKRENEIPKVIEQ